MGNKTAILPILYSKFPATYDRYIEPFGGSAAVLLGKAKPDRFEVYNDYNRDLVNLFRCIRDQPLTLLRELQLYPLNARDDFEELKVYLERAPNESDPYTSLRESELDLTSIILPEPRQAELRELMRSRVDCINARRAAIFLKVLRTSYASTGENFAGRPFSMASLNRLIRQTAKRLQHTIIENQDFEQVIRHYNRPGAFIYCDPPYVNTEHFYDSGFNWADHLRLFYILNQCYGLWLLSYNDCPEIRRLYNGYYFYEFKRTHSMAHRYHAGAQFPELLIANFDINTPLQMDLFSDKQKSNLNDFTKGGF